MLRLHGADKALNGEFDVSRPPEEQGGDPAKPKHDRTAGSKQRKREQHEENMEIVAALNRVADELMAAEKQNSTSEKNRKSREYLTIWLVFLTVLLTFAADVIFYFTMAEAKHAADLAHADSASALTKSHSDSLAALDKAHGDSVAALNGANKGATGALARATEANKISKEALDAVQRPFVFPESLQIKAQGVDRLNPDRWEFSYNWENSGATPALRLRISLRCWESTVGLGGKAKYPKLISGGEETFLAPHASQEIGICSFSVPELTRMGRNNMTFFYMARADYADSLDPTLHHTTITCSQIRPYTQIGAQDGLHAFGQSSITCPNVGCADEQCRHK